LPDHPRPDDRHAHETIRTALAHVLGAAVIASIIGESVVRCVLPSRPALIAIALVAGTFAVSTVWTIPTGARSTTAPTLPADLEFRRVEIASEPTPTPQRRLASTVSVTPVPAAPATATPRPEAPSVVRFRPRHGWTGVSRFAALSVRFTSPMDHASTERAFTAHVGKRLVGGRVRWAEGDTVLVLTPAAPLPHGARIVLSVDDRALAKDGSPLAAARSATFRVRSRPAAVERPPAASPRAPERSVPVTGSGGWRWPLLGRITQRFGQSLTRYGFHQGIDIDGVTGDPVRAARRGRVILAGRADACGGIQVRIDHGGGIVSWYRHLSRTAVRSGVTVEAGRTIGRVGDTGCSLGSHLHFAIARSGTFVDPLRYLPSR
jgi:murein DD-endopeptidase MepM/ murein hydrolase activator NlpD